MEINGKIINYQGYEVVYSHSAECPREVTLKGMKFHPVYDSLDSITTAMIKLKRTREELEKIRKNRWYEYSSYILKKNNHTFELHFKCYIMP